MVNWLFGRITCPACDGSGNTGSYHPGDTYKDGKETRSRCVRKIDGE